MTQLEKAREQLDEILDKIPASGSFEGARLAKEASKVADKISELCSHPDADKKTEEPHRQNGH